MRTPTAFVVISILATAAAALEATQITPKRQGLTAEVAISTLPEAEIRQKMIATELEHDTEVGRDENITAMLRINGCDKGCNASADIVLYKPDGTVHSEMKNVVLKNGRATLPLKLAPSDPTGIYRIVATARDLDARRFGTSERKFGVRD